MAAANNQLDAALASANTVVGGLDGLAKRGQAELELGHGLKIGVAGCYCESNEATYRVALSTLGQKCSSGALPRNC
jgi:hypothetical protein